MINRVIKSRLLFKILLVKMSSNLINSPNARVPGSSPGGSTFYKILRGRAVVARQAHLVNKH